MQESELHLIEVAHQRRLLTRKQAEVIREELEHSPGISAGEMMLRRHYVTVDQLDELYNELGIAFSREDFDVAEETYRASQEQLQAPPVTQRPNAGRPVAPPPSRNQGGEQPRPFTPAPLPHTPAPEPAKPAEVDLGHGLPRNLAGFLQLARHWKASDLHLAVGRPPFFRINGTHRYMETEPLTEEQCRQLNFSALTEDQADTALKDLQLDFALEVRGVGRYRCNIWKHRLGWDGSYRVIGTSIPTIEQLGLPATVKVFTEYAQGLVMITGPGGAGKTTTAYALLDLVNDRRRDHIITVEDPIEYILSPKKCQVMQREVGKHTNAFGTALRAALREDPDIILIGEMRDYETTSIAISAAETGHLVFGTLGTSSSARTVARIVDAYPVSQQAQVCTMVAESLRGVISQLLLPRSGVDGRVLSYEIMVNTSGIAQQIKDGKTYLIPSLIQNGKRQGMCLMDDSLRRLFDGGMISGRTAYRFCENKPAFESIKDQE